MKFRNFLENVNFKNIFSIDDITILDKIHSNYRLIYLRDTVIGRFVEENTVKNINYIIHFNNSDILQYFTNHKNLIIDLFKKIQSTNFEERYQGMTFLSELIQICKDLVIHV